MKTIQTVIISADQIVAQVSAAATVARARDGHLDVLCLGLDHSDIAYGQAGTYLSLVQLGVTRASEEASLLRTAVSAHLASLGPDVRWAADELIAMGGTLGLALQPRLQLADLVVLHRPAGFERASDATAVLEAALLDARVPVLMLADGQNAATAIAPQRVVIAWNRSNEAMTAVRAALPLLRQAQEVCISVVDQASTPPDQAEPGRHLGTVLARHGINVTVAVLPRSTRAVGEVLAQHLTDFGADLLVMGAYGHSRLREALFGGATRDMLDHCPVPALLAH